MSKIVCIYVNESRRTGQKRVTFDVLSILKLYSDDVKTVEFSSGFSLRNFCLWIVSFCSIVFDGPINKYIYLVCSRSLFGFIRDLPYLLLSLIGFRVIIHVHGADIFELFEGKIGTLAKFAYKNVETIYPSRLGALQLEKYTSRSHVVSAMSSCRPESDKDYDEFTIVWNTHVCFSKGIKLALEACDTLYSKGYQFKFVCFGEVLADFMASAVECNSFISKFDQSPWFVRVGSVPEFVVQSALARSSCNLLVSTYPAESQGMSAVDAIASGIPVILSKADCFMDFEGYPSVTLINPETDDLIGALENKMIEFYRSPDLYFDAALVTLSLIGDEFSSERFCKRIHAILDEGAPHGR